MKKRLRVAGVIAIGFFALLIIIGITTNAGDKKPVNKVSPAPSVSLTTGTVTATPGKSVVAPRTAVSSVATQNPTAAPNTPTQTSAVACHPLTGTGKCYEPGEYCRISDHGVYGVAGDGVSIVCENKDGWRWEPA
jgi:hypothetical protein